jgi:hypothetical protein
MGKIIGFAGRCRSGKTELAKVCVEHGYKKLYFALPLKQLCANILEATVEALNQAKDKGIDISLRINDNICDILSTETGIPIEQVKETCYGKTLNTVREMLQFIGTDLIRNYNPDWHVNRIKEMINPELDYVIDDVRFPNEKKLIEDLGGQCWFVTRTTLDNVSNHVSETSITINDCWNRIIINDNTLHYLLFKWDTFMGNYEKSCTIRDKEFNRILETGDETGLGDMTMFDMLFIHKDLFSYYPKDFDKETIKDIKMNDDKSVVITFNDESREFITNTLNIEDIKILI